MGQHSNIDDTGDVDILVRGDSFPVYAGPSLRDSGWRGGLWVQYVDGDQEFTVEVSDGNSVAGFLLAPSETRVPPGSVQNWTSIQLRRLPGVTTLSSEGPRGYFKMFETVALSGGTRSGSAITYTRGESLKVSENGLLCNDSDSELALAGVTAPHVVGIVSSPPSTRNQSRLGADIKY